MRIFQQKSFKKWAEDEGLTESDLLTAIEEMDNGLIDANLGGNVYKKRVKLEGRGKRSGARTLVIYKLDFRAFFIIGFAKNERDNVNHKEEKALKLLAKELFNYTDEELQRALEIKEFFEITKEK